MGNNKLAIFHKNTGRFFVPAILIFIHPDWFHPSNRSPPSEEIQLDRNGSAKAVKPARLALIIMLLQCKQIIGNVALDYKTWESQ
jgi:hypothetical protein